jgi:hypothetical protein
MIAIFVFALVGGFVFGALALAYICAHDFSSFPLELEHSTTEKQFRDGVTIAGISLAPQCLILLIPWIYPNVTDVPDDVCVAATGCASALLALWCWGSIMLFRAGRAGLLLTWKSRGLLLCPPLVSFTTVVGFWVGRIH